jgi:hypothetical protein
MISRKSNQDLITVLRIRGRPNAVKGIQRHAKRNALIGLLENSSDVPLYWVEMVSSGVFSCMYKKCWNNAAVHAHRGLEKKWIELFVRLRAVTVHQNSKLILTPTQHHVAPLSSFSLSWHCKSSFFRHFQRHGISFRTCGPFHLLVVIKRIARSRKGRAHARPRQSWWRLEES